MKDCNFVGNFHSVINILNQIRQRDEAFAGRGCSSALCVFPPVNCNASIIESSSKSLLSQISSHSLLIWILSRSIRYLKKKLSKFGLVE